MKLPFLQSTRILTAAVLAWSLAVPHNLPAQSSDHLVSPQELSKAAQDSTQVRQQNIATLQGFFSSTQAKQALEDAHMSQQQVQNAVSGLDDQELAQLATRATNAQSQFAAGSMSDHDLLLIIVVVAVVILLIAILH